MALNNSTIERLAEWSANSETLADIRPEARRKFFGAVDLRKVNYMGGSGDGNGPERRFLGWFAFGFKLPDGRHPAEMAANTLLNGPDLASALIDIPPVKYVTAVVKFVIPGRGVFLELENKEFQVDSRILSHELQKDDVLCAYLIPAGRGRWLASPGWLVWPARFGPGIRARLKKFQLNPIKVERFLQQRRQRKKKPEAEWPQDDSLEKAIARMTEAARSESREKLVMPAEEWQSLVLAHMDAGTFMQFSQEIIGRVGSIASLDDANKWFHLAMNIWNNTPQPDRGGRSARELAREPRNNPSHSLDRQDFTF
jgi:hypothetical protein